MTCKLLSKYFYNYAVPENVNNLEQKLYNPQMKKRDSHETYYKSVQDFITFMYVFMTLFHYNFQYYITVILPRSNARNYFNFVGLLIYEYSVFFLTQ